MNPEQNYIDDYISPEERQHFLYLLHRYLAWVGERIPEELGIDGRSIKLHELVWRCIHKKHFSEQDKKRIMELVHILEKKEKYDEEMLKKANLSHEEAKRLYRESAGLLRAIVDLKECETGRLKLRESGEEIQKKVDDIKRWIKFLENIK